MLEPSFGNPTPCDQLQDDVYETRPLKVLNNDLRIDDEISQRSQKSQRSSLNSSKIRYRTPIVMMDAPFENMDNISKQTNVEKIKQRVCEELKRNLDRSEKS